MPSKSTQAKKKASEDSKKKTTVKKKTGVKKTAPKKTSPKKAVSSKKEASPKKDQLVRTLTPKLVEQEKIVEAPKRPAKTITIDVIADDQDAVLASNQEFIEEVVDIDELDSQKKYFSELVEEIKSKQDKLPEEELNSPPTNKSLNLYRRLVLRFLFLVGLSLLIIAYFTVTKLVVVVTPAAEAISDSVQFQVKENVEASTIDGLQVVPGVVTSTVVTLEKVYPATGEENIGEEIIGKVTIYNNYTRNQPLIATTRLLTADQKLFRIKEGVTVPAGGSVEVEVYSDQINPEMAIEPSRFTIPGLWLGLQDQIYAESQEKFEYRGKVNTYVRQRDIDLAANDLRKALTEKLKQEIAWQTKPGEAVAYFIEENKSLLTLGADLNDSAEDFLAKAENQAVIIRFSKERSEEILRAKLAFSLPDDKILTSFNSEDITYNLIEFDLEQKTANISANFSGATRLKESAEFIDNRQLSGLNEAQITEYLKSFSEVADFELKFFPKFLTRAPYLADRIKIEIKD